jgi:hypothetical protein
VKNFQFSYFKQKEESEKGTGNLNFVNIQKNFADEKKVVFHHFFNKVTRYALQ